MKKLLMGLLVIGAVLAVSVGQMKTVSALTPQTDVTGVITDAGVPVENAEVTVTCGSVTEMDTTDAYGSYLVRFTMAQCPNGSEATTTAKKGDKSGTASGDVKGVTTKLNTALVNVSIPEYGWIGGITATAAGIGAIAFTRRRFSGRGASL